MNDILEEKNSIKSSMTFILSDSFKRKLKHTMRFQKALFKKKYIISWFTLHMYNIRTNLSNYFHRKHLEKTSMKYFESASAGISAGNDVNVIFPV